MRGSFAFVMLCALLLVAGGAGATSPLPKFEQRVNVPDVEQAIVEGGSTFKREIPERCLPRNVLCVGPMEPDMEITLGTTGVRFYTRNVTAVAGHDPARVQSYGPYAAPTLFGDDARACSSGCKLPDPWYAGAHVNATVEVYTLGDKRAYSFDETYNVTTLHPPFVPRSWCHLAMYTTC